jgi:hypothetical protein
VLLDWGSPLRGLAVLTGAAVGVYTMVPANSARSGLIIKELGDAPPASSFRFTDTGSAPRR